MQGHAPAYTALGWYALNHQRNVTAAVKYFEKADKMGHRDAAHNLGYLYRVGKYPNHAADEVRQYTNAVYPVVITNLGS